MTGLVRLTVGREVTRATGAEVADRRDSIGHLNHCFGSRCLMVSQMMEQVQLAHRQVEQDERGESDPFCDTGTVHDIVREKWQIKCWTRLT